MMGHSPTLLSMLDGYLTALSMGIILGVIGAGGSILTLPILVISFGSAFSRFSLSCGGCFRSSVAHLCGVSL